MNQELFDALFLGVFWFGLIVFLLSAIVLFLRDRKPVEKKDNSYDDKEIYW